MTQVLQSLKEAAIFMLGAQVLMYLGPGKKYDKYGKMIVSLLVLAQLAEPLLNFSEDLGKISFSSHLRTYEQQNDAFLDRLELLEENSDGLMWEGMVLSVEEQLTQEAKDLGVRIERVFFSGGKLVIEAGLLDTDNRVVSAEKLSEKFAKTLGVEKSSLEVVISG